MVTNMKEKKMKKLLASLMAVGLIAGIADAQVYSQNAVGYVKVEVPASGFKLVSTPFVNLDGSEQTIDDIFGDSIPDSSTVFIWSVATQTYEVYTFIDGLGWVDNLANEAGDTVVARGDGVWFQNPESAAQELFIMGEVPGQALDEEDISIPAAFRLFSFAFPAEMNIEDTDLVPADSDTIYEWLDSQAYAVYTYIDGLGWVDNLANEVDIILQPGRAYWYQSGTSQTWTQSRPYTWP